MKILIILVLIFSFIVLLLGLGIRFVKGLFKPFSQSAKVHVDKSKEVIYQKDDIVIMKGDAGSPNKN